VTGAGGGGYGTGNRMLRDSGGPTVLPPPSWKKWGEYKYIWFMESVRISKKF